MAKFYTVDRAGSLSEGMAIELITDYVEGRGCEGFYTHEQAIERARSMFPDGLSNHGANYLLGMPPPSCFVTNQIGLRIAVGIEGSMAYELLFEAIRRAEFATAPSRLQSMFAWHSLHDAIAFRKECQMDESPIYEIVTDRYHVADIESLVFGVNGAGGFEMAHRYWSGMHSASPRLEVVIPLPQIVGACAA